MPEQHKKLLAGLGVPQDQIDALEAVTPETLKDWTPDPLLLVIRGNMKNTLLNDSSFLDSIPEDKIPDATKKKIESGQYARFQNELLEVATKKLGLDEKETLTDEDKKSIKKMVEKIATGYLAKNGNVEGLKKMQTELADALQKLEAKDTDWQTKMTTEVDKINGTNSTKMIKVLTQVRLASLDKIKLNLAPNYLADPALSKLEQKYNVVVIGDQLDIKQKDNKALDVIDSAGKKITFDAALRSVVIEEKFGAEVAETKPTETRKVIVNTEQSTGDPIEVPDYIANKIKENTVESEAAK